MSKLLLVLTTIFTMNDEFEHDHEHEHDCDCCSGCNDHDFDGDFDEELQTVMIDVDGENIEFGIVASFEYLDMQYLAVTPIEGEGETVLFLKNSEPDDENSEWLVVEDEGEITSLYDHIVQLMDEDDDFEEDLED